MSSLLKQIIKFGVVGGTAFLIDYCIMILLTEVVNINYLVSNTISFTVSVIYNYILSVYWIFDVDNKKNKHKNFFSFIILSIMGLIINQIVMLFTVQKIGINYMIAKIIATVIVMVYNFISRKVFLERKG